MCLRASSVSKAIRSGQLAGGTMPPSLIEVQAEGPGTDLVGNTMPPSLIEVQAEGPGTGLAGSTMPPSLIEAQGEQCLGACQQEIGVPRV